MSVHDDEMLDQELDRPATRRDLLALRTALTASFDSRFDEIRRHLDEEMKAGVTDVRRHFDVVAESFKTEFKTLFDWTQATTSTIGARVDHVDVSHGARLTSVEFRVTRLEQRRKPRSPATS